MKARDTSVGRVTWGGVALAVVLTAGCGDPLPVVDGDLAFVGVNVLPMTASSVPVVLENRTVVIADRRIASINPADEVQVGDEVEVIVAAGQYLMPGLAEMRGYLPDPRMLPADAKNLLFLHVANGVTTLRAVQVDRPRFALRDQIARGETFGPRLFLASPPLSGARVTMPTQAEQLVREYKERGYDLVEVDGDLTLDVFDAMAATAKEVGIPFGGQVSDRVGLLHALAVGQGSIDNLDGYIQALVPEERRVADPSGQIGAVMPTVDERRILELVAATRAAGARVVPTMVLWEAAFNGGRSAAELRARRPEVRYMPPETVEAWERAVAERPAAVVPEVADRATALRQTIAQALYSGGVPLLLGTDSPQIFHVPGFAMHHEMRLWVEFGMTPYEVLETGTRRAAEYFAATDEFGSIVVGHRADLLLLTANPIEDIANLARRAGVMLNGRWIPERQIQARLAEIATFYGN